MAQARSSASAPIVLPVGGGKGGIGKSALAANLGLVLARLDHRVILIDADLGSSDLHNLLGLDNPGPGVGELLASKDLKLAEVAAPVLEKGLGLVPGDAMMVGTANPGYHKKRKFLHAVRGLEADFVLLDLGPGTSITVLDFYLTSPLALLVMLPERTAVLNTLNFLKNAQFRALERLFKRNAKTAQVLASFQAGGRDPQAMQIPQLIEAMDQALPGEGKRAQRAVERWRPKLILNRVRRVDDFIHAHSLEKLALAELGLHLEVMAFLPEDDLLWEASQDHRPALDLDPRAPFSQALTLLGLKIAAWAGRGAEWQRHRSFEDSFERSATEFSHFFPPPGTSLPTKDELLRRLKELEAAAGI